MAYLTYHVARVAKWARIAGLFSAISYIFIALILTAIAYRIPEYKKQTLSMSWLFGFWACIYLIPGISMWWFGRLLEAGKMWAYVPIAALAIFDLTKLFFVGAICGGLFSVSCTLLLMAFVLNAIPDMRDHYRRWRRQRDPRGFPVILAQRSKPAAPPPPGRSPRPGPPGQ